MEPPLVLLSLVEQAFALLAAQSKQSEVANVDHVNPKPYKPETAKAGLEIPYIRTLNLGTASPTFYTHKSPRNRF